MTGIFDISLAEECLKREIGVQMDTLTKDIECPKDKKSSMHDCHIEETKANIESLKRAIVVLRYFNKGA